MNLTSILPSFFDGDGTGVVLGGCADATVAVADGSDGDDGHGHKVGDDAISRMLCGMLASSSMKTLALAWGDFSKGKGGATIEGAATATRCSNCCCLNWRLLRGERDADVMRWAALRNYALGNWRWFGNHHLLQRRMVFEGEATSASRLTSYSG